MEHKITPKPGINNLNTILEKLEKLHHIKDIHSLINSILAETRDITNADAGSIFITENNKLKFSYVQNDTLFSNDVLCNKYIYSNREIDIDKSSLAGYVALTGNPLMIDNAYNISKNAPYSFNPYFDKISSYRTTSMLIIPLKAGENKVVGVLELINAKNEKGEIVSFSEEDKLFAMQFTYYVTVAIERAIMIRDLVYRMITLSQLRDPEETQEHVNRVGAFSIEIYQKWAENHSVSKNEIDNYKDILRIGAMLHDIGKVGISDVILKKKGPLSRDEYNIMQNHTILGAQVFMNSDSDWEKIATEITLNHHEKWDGSGYPGKIDITRDNDMKLNKGKKGTEIPLSARIVALADVYDALFSKRTYKDPWEEDKVLFYIKEQSGKQFDPEIVDIFFGIYDTIKAIRSKWE